MSEENKEILNRIKIAYIKDIENKIDECVSKKVPLEVFLAALANLLIRNCTERSVNKETFLQKLSEGWDYHISSNEKTDDLISN
jgi:hypothetical protein